jgi:hypothetical protein
VEPTQNTRARLLLAVCGLIGLGILIGVVVLAGGGEDEHEFTVAPGECVERWNDSRDALATGRHNSAAHSYFRVQVAYASEDGATVSSEPVSGGSCITIFAASQLDPEPIAAAEINQGRRWVPLSATADTARLAELQSEALGAYNAELGQDGRLTPLAADAT